MKILFILASAVAVAYAGVGYLTYNEELEALRLYKNYCSGGSDGGAAGNTFIYCKKAKEDYVEELNHNIRLQPGYNAQRQVIFVQPPSYYYKHNVTLTGARNGQQRAIIYVLPPKNTHTVDHSDLRDFRYEEPQKPQLFFLKSDPRAVSEGGSPGAVAVSNDEDTSSPSYPILPTPLRNFNRKVFNANDYNYVPPTAAGKTSGGY